MKKILLLLTLFIWQNQNRAAEGNSFSQKDIKTPLQIAQDKLEEMNNSMEKELLEKIAEKVLERKIEALRNKLLEQNLSGKELSNALDTLVEDAKNLTQREANITEEELNNWEKELRYALRIVYDIHSLEKAVVKEQLLEENVDAIIREKISTLKTNIKSIEAFIEQVKLEIGILKESTDQNLKSEIKTNLKESIKKVMDLISNHQTEKKEFYDVYKNTTTIDGQKIQELPNLCIAIDESLTKMNEHLKTLKELSTEIDRL